MISSVIIFFVALIIKLNRDVWLWKHSKRNDHNVGPAIVTAVIALCTIIAGWITLPLWLFGWWVLFDGLYNIMIGQRWGRVGTTAQLDILQRKYPWLVWVKYIGFILSLILFIWQST